MKRTTFILGYLPILLFAVISTDIMAQNLSAGICKRTEQVQTAIIAEVSGKTDCATITTTDLAGITGTLNLKSKSITSLKAGDFDGLTNLSKLILRSNSMSILPEGVFDQLSSLIELDLYGNGLGSLPENVFDQLTSLSILDLNENSLSSLPAGVFDQLSSLTQLRLYRNGLSSLPADVFDQLTSLRILNLNNNRLSSLLPGVFDSLTNLIALGLRFNKLSSLPEGIFDQLNNLTGLVLAGNQLHSLSNDVFDGLIGMTELHMGYNDLTSLPEQLFDNTKNLIFIDLSGNNLNTLPAFIFDGLTKLKRVVLRSNSLISLSAGIFDDLASLQVVVLTKNKDLSCLPRIPSTVKLLWLDKHRSAYVACEDGAPAVKVSDITATTAKLTLSGHALAWSYRFHKGTCIDVNAKTSEVIFHDLTPGSDYFVTVSNAVGCPVNGNPNPIIDQVTFTALLRKVEDVSAEMKQIVLSVDWTLQSDITGYHVQWKIGSQNWSSDRQLSVTSNSAMITILEDHTECTVRVRSYQRGYNSRIKYGEWSNEVSSLHVAELTEEEAVKSAVEDSLAAFGRGILSSIDAGLGSRLRREFGEGMRIGGYSVPFGENRTKDEYPEHQYTRQHDREPRVASLDWLEGTSFALALSDSETEASAGEVPGWQFWGYGDIQSFQAERSSIDGELRTAYIGIDTGQSDSGLFGVALSNSRGRTDYNHDTGSGQLRTSLTSIYPYLRLRTGDNSTLWAILGLGSGRIENQATGLSSVERGDLSMYMFAGGGRYDLNSDSSGIDLALLSDAAILRLNTETDSPQDALDDVSASVRRIRFGLEASYEIPMERGVLSPFGHLSARYDGGDGETGSGVEIAGGLHYRYDRLSFEMGGRAFRMGGGSHRQYGWGMGLELKPREFGEGISFSLSPKWGESRRTSLQSMWSSPHTLSVQDAVGEANRNTELSTKIRYGLRWPSTAALVTPYVAYDSLASGGSRTNLGVDLRLKSPSSSLKFDLRGEFEQSQGREDSAGIYLDVVLRF